jgi:hypothetical protein
MQLRPEEHAAYWIIVIKVIQQLYNLFSTPYESALKGRNLDVSFLDSRNKDDQSSELREQFHQSA